MYVFSLIISLDHFFVVVSFSLVCVDISTLNGSVLKLVDGFTYQGNSVSLTETDINTLLAKV